MELAEFAPAIPITIVRQDFQAYGGLLVEIATLRQESRAHRAGQTKDKKDASTPESEKLKLISLFAGLLVSA